MRNHERSRRSLLAAACVLTLAGCGSGGGSSPTPAPPGPPSIESTRTVIAQGPAQCTVQLCDFGLHLDAVGRYVVFWREPVASPPSTRIRATAASFGSTAIVSAGIVVTPPAGVPYPFQSFALGGDAFAVFQTYDPFPGIGAPPLAVRVQMTPGVPTPGAQVNVATQLVRPSVVQDGAGGLFVSQSDLSNVDIGNGTIVRLMLNTPDALPEVRHRSDLTPYRSLGERAARGLIGRESGSADWHVYVQDVPLVAGPASPPPARVSLQPVRLRPDPPQPGPPIGCPQVSLHPSGADSMIAAWTSVDAAGSACDLFVDGVKLNAQSACCGFTYAIAATNSAVLVAWSGHELSSQAIRLRWARLERATGIWSPPASIAPEFFDANETQLLLANAVSPGGTALAISWGRPDGSAFFLSKFASGRWTTVAAPPGTLRGLAINDGGGTVALYQQCSGSTCTDVATYSF